MTDRLSDAELDGLEARCEVPQLGLPDGIKVFGIQDVRSLIAEVREWRETFATLQATLAEQGIVLFIRPGYELLPDEWKRAVTPRGHRDGEE